jgi:hypothetical protein
MTFAPTNYEIFSSHCSFISIQQSKNQNLKTEIPQITNPFSTILIYKRRDEERERERERLD